MLTLGKIILGTLRSALAIILAYIAFHVVVILPVWCWGLIAEPIDITSISIIKIILIIVIIGVILSTVQMWLMALAMLPGTIIHYIGARPLWAKFTATTFLSLCLIAMISLYIIAYKYGLVRISDGSTSIAAELPIGHTVYSSICALISIIGMPFTILSLDENH